MPRDYLGSGTGFVFVVLGKRILGGKPGETRGFPERQERGLSLCRTRKD